VISTQNVHGITYKFPGNELIHVPEDVKIFTNPELVQKPSDGAVSAATVTETISKQVGSKVSSLSSNSSFPR
jgi:hypothetical protein